MRHVYKKHENIQNEYVSHATEQKQTEIDPKQTIEKQTEIDQI
jgi:hypothetical protein